jgi:hypothetical protein
MAYAIHLHSCGLKSCYFGLAWMSRSFFWLRLGGEWTCNHRVESAW